MKNLIAKHIVGQYELEEYSDILTIKTNKDSLLDVMNSLKNNKALERLAMLKGVKLEKATFSFIFNNLSHLSDYVKQIDSPTFKILKRT